MSTWNTLAPDLSQPMFSIRFLSAQEVSDRGLISQWNEPAKAAFGEITIGDFSEVFLSPLLYWSRDQYLFHWKRSLGNILVSGRNSYLVTSIDLPERRRAATVWQIYVFSERLIFQNHLVFPENIRYPVPEFQPGLPELEYKQTDEDGEKVSEWEIQKQELSLFCEKSILSGVHGDEPTPK